MWSVSTTRLSGVSKRFAASEMGESMDADLLPELSGETWVAAALTEEFTADLPAGCNIDLIAESRSDDTLAVVRGWIQSNSTPTLDRLCRNVSGIALLEAANREFVHQSGWPVMAKTSITGGGFSTRGTM